MTESTLSISLDELERAAEFVHTVVPPTPQYAWPKLRQRAGCTVWVKHENHTPTSAFKVRGGLIYLDRLVKMIPSGVVGLYLVGNGVIPGGAHSASNAEARLGGSQTSHPHHWTVQCQGA